MELRRSDLPELRLSFGSRSSHRPEGIRYWWIVFFHFQSAPETDDFVFPALEKTRMVLCFVNFVNSEVGMNAVLVDHSFHSDLLYSAPFSKWSLENGIKRKDICCWAKPLVFQAPAERNVKPNQYSIKRCQLAFCRIFYRTQISSDMTMLKGKEKTRDQSYINLKRSQ